MMTRWYDEKIAYIVWCVAHMHIHKTKGLLWGSIILICVDRTYRFLVGFLFVFDSLFFPRHKPCMQIYFYTCITYIKTKDAAIPFVIILSSMCACAYNKIWLAVFRCCYCRSNCRCPVHVDMLLIVLWMSLIENSLASQSSFFWRLLPCVQGTVDAIVLCFFLVSFNGTICYSNFYPVDHYYGLGQGIYVLVEKPDFLMPIECLV